MKKHILNIVIVLMFVIGFSVLLYPAISEYINSKHASRIIASYNETVKNSDEAELKQLIDEADDYNKRLSQNSSAFYNPDLVSGYDDALDITGNGVMGYIDIDKLNLELPIYHGVSKEVLQIGVGHLPGTSLPVGGESTHAVLSGHRGLPSAKLFTDLNEMEVGDTFTVTVLDRVYTYEVDQIKVVLPSETSDLQIVKGEDHCTLMTCTPYGINTHRLLVRGVRIESAEAVRKVGVVVKNEAFRIDPLIVMPIVAIPFLLIAITAVFIHDKKKNQKKKAGG